MKPSKTIVDAVARMRPEIPREHIEQAIESLFTLALPPIAMGLATLLSSAAAVFAELPPHVIDGMISKLGDPELFKHEVQAAIAKLTENKRHAAPEALL